VKRARNKQTFSAVTVPPGAHASELSFVDCKFDRCRTPVGLLNAALEGPAFVTLERSEFVRPKSDVQRISLVVLREVTIEDWHTGREPVFVKNCLFDRVSLRGFVGDLMVQSELAELTNAELEIALDFYDSVDWALDIRQASFGSTTLSGVPGEKVLFDPERHCRVFKDRLLANAGWREFPETLVSSIESWLELPYASVVTIAGDRSKYFDQWKADHALLREHGYAE
jgi:hypothetical protein